MLHRMDRSGLGDSAVRPAGSGEFVAVRITGAGGPARAECLRRVRASRGVRVELAAGSGDPVGRFLLELPGHAGLGRRSLARLLREADRRRVGLVSVLLPGAATGCDPVRLWRVPAYRAVRTGRRPGEDLSVTAGRLVGVRWEAGSSFGIVDLRQPLPARVPAPVRVHRWALARLPAPGYARLAGRLKTARRRVRDRLFLD